MIWLASYPRSGNTLMRQILRQCFGMKSGSVYPNDLGGNKALEEACGHVELDRQHGGVTLDESASVVKTHELPCDGGHAIYIIRDGRAACVSLWNYWNRALPLIEVVRGNHRFGLWGEHATAWIGSANLLTAFRYEQLVSRRNVDTLTILRAAMYPVLGAIKYRSINPPYAREHIADGKWITKASNWREHWTPDIDAEFWRLNGETMRVFYPDEKCIDTAPQPA